MTREEVVARHVRGRPLNAVGLRTAVGEPVGSFGGEPRVAPYHLGVRVVALVEPGVQQDDMAVHPDAGLLLGRFELCHVDLAQIRYVREVETHSPTEDRKST